MSYISTRLYKKMIDCAVLEGLDARLLDQLPTRPEELRALKVVPADHFFFLHEYLDEQLGPGYAVRVGQQMKMDDYGVLGLSWKTCSWAGEIFDRCERYFKLLSNTYVFKVEEEGTYSHVYLNRSAHRKGVEFSNEATLSATVVVMRAMTETDISPLMVAFQHQPPISLESHREAFQCSIQFNQPYNRITYYTRDLRQRTAKADVSINRFLLERVEEETQGIEISPHQITLEVEQLIKDALPSGIPGLVQIGRYLGMSNRTLTRRLTENGNTFRGLVRKVQLQVAQELLADQRYSMADIAFATGFSEQSAFSRAFKRWTGQSPVDFRRNS